jgi:hypothetical protein
MVRSSTQIGVFDSAMIHILSSALEDAWQRAEASGVQFDHQGEPARGALAKHIMDMAGQGEVDPKRLVKRALLRLFATRRAKIPRRLGGAPQRRAASSASKPDSRESRTDLRGRES